MKLSELTREEIAAIPFEKKVEFICGSIVDDGMSAPVAILLGGNPNNARPRAIAAAELYKSGRVPFIVPSGGVKWDVDGEQISESHYMKRILMENGVPEEAIILENQATTTKENMMYASIVINRVLRMTRVKRVIIVTSFWHLRRSVALAKLLLPRHMEVSGYAAYPEGFSGENWHKSDELRKWFESEMNLLKDLVNKNLMEDIEY